MKINLLAISYAKRVLEDGSRDRLRMKKYAAVMKEMHIIVFTKKSDNLPEQQQDGNLYIYGTNAQTRLGMLWSAIKIGRQVIARQKNQHFIVSSQDPFETSLVGRLIVLGNRAVHHVQIHGDVFNPLSYKVSLLQRLRVIYGCYVVRKTKKIRVVSDRIRRSLVVLGVKKEVMTVLPIQSDLQSFLEAGDSRLYSKERKLSFLSVGRFASEKNLMFLLQAFNVVIKKHPSATLTLLGSGPELIKIKKEIRNKGLDSNVLLVDWTDDVAAVMAKHDVLCLASNHEGWGMVLLEAGATGMPVITTDVGCVGEVIVNEQQGFVVSVGDKVGYVEALSRFLSDPTLIEKFGQRGHSTAQSFYLPEDVYLSRLVDSFL